MQRLYFIGATLLSLLLNAAGVCLASEARDYQNARALYEKGLYILAADEARNLLERFPDGDYRADTRFLLGDSELRRGRYREARDAFRLVISEVARPDLHDDALARQAECDLQLEDFSAVLEDTARHLKLYPGSPWEGRMYLLAGQAHRFLSEPAKALEAFDQAAQKSRGEDRSASLFYAGHAALDLNDAVRAAGYFRRAWEENKTGRYAQEALLYLAESFLRSDDYEQTIKTADEFQMAWPQSIYLGDMLLRAAQAHAELKQTDQAIRIYCSIIGAAIPGLCASGKSILSASAQTDRITGYAGLGLARTVPDAEAPSAYDSLLKWSSGRRTTQAFNPRSFAASILLQKARNLMFNNDWDQAREALSDLLNRYPERDILPDALLDQAQCLFKLNRHAETVTVSERYLKDFAGESGAPRARLYLARACAAQDRIADASKAFHLILADASAPAEIRSQAAYYCGAMLYKTGDLQTALARFSDVTTITGVPIDLRADAERARAECLYQLERYPEAMESYRAAIREYAALPEKAGEAAAARLALGWALFKAGDIASASRDFVRIASEDPFRAHRLEAQFMLGECALALKRLDEAEKTFQAVASASPEGDFGLIALYRAAWSAYRKEDWSRAADGFEQFLRKAGATRRTEYRGQDLLDAAAFHRAWALSQSDREKEAEPLFVALATRDASGERSAGEYAARAWVAAGDICYNAERYREAAECYERAATLYPQDPAAPGALHSWGWALQADGQAHAAAEIWEQLAIRYPDSPLAREALYSGGETLYQEKDYSGAARIFEEFIHKYPDSEEAREASYWLGRSRVAAGDVLAGARALAAFSRSYPDSAQALDALFYSAQAFETGGRDATAVLYYREILNQAQDLPSATDSRAILGGEALYALGKMAERREQFEEAAGLYARAASLPGAAATTQRAALLAEGDAWRKTDQLEKSLKPYRNLIAQDQGDNLEASARYGEGLALESLGRYEEAVAGYLRIPNLHGQDNSLSAPAQARAGACLEKLERWSEAAKVYEQCLSSLSAIKNSEELRKQVKERLEWIQKNEAILDLELPRSSASGTNQTTP